MADIIPFPSPELRERLVIERADKTFDEALAVAAYDWVAASERMIRLCEPDNPPTLRLCAAMWLGDEAGLRPKMDPPMRPSDV